MEGTTLVEGTSTDRTALPGMVEPLVSFTGFIFVFVGACLCVQSSTTPDLLRLLDFFIASAFLLGAISILDGNRDGEIEEVISSKNKRKEARTSKNKRERARNKEKTRGERN